MSSWNQTQNHSHGIHDHDDIPAGNLAQEWHWKCTFLVVLEADSNGRNIYYMMLTKNSPIELTYAKQKYTHTQKKCIIAVTSHEHYVNSNHWQVDCLLYSLFMLTSTEKGKHRRPASRPLCKGNPLVIIGFPSQRDCEVESISISWHPDFVVFQECWICVTKLLKTNTWHMHSRVKLAWMAWSHNEKHSWHETNCSCPGTDKMPWNLVVCGLLRKQYCTSHLWYFLSTVNIVNSVWATAFIFDSRTDDLVTVPKF